jgi:signal peptidase I
MSGAGRRQVVFIFVFLVVVLLFVTTFRMGIVHGNSMNPTYENGQVLLVRRRNMLSGPLHHNDVVFLRVNRDVIIKRIYRLPGEELGDSFFYNDAAAYRSGLADYYEQLPQPGGQPPRLVVPEGFLVVIGDNLKESEDSRVFGPVAMRDVLGVVVNSPPPPYANSASGVDKGRNARR